MANQAEQKKVSWKTRLARLAPYLVAAGALYWVFRTTDLAELKKVITHAPLALFISVSAAMLVLNCAADVFAMGRVFSWFGVKIPFRELYVVRASTYLIAIVNYHVGQAALAGYLYRARRVPPLRASGMILFIIGINVGTLFLLASGGAARGGTGGLRVLRLVPFICAVGVLFYGAILLAKPRIIAERRLFAPLFEMGIRGHIFGVLVRLPHVFVLMAWHFASLRMFGIQVTPGAAVLYLPVYFAVTSLPGNVSGLGPAQGVAIALFSQFVTPPDGLTDPKLIAAAQHASVVAYSVATSTVSIILQLGLGLMFLRRGTALGLSTHPEELPEPPPEKSTTDERLSSPT